MADIPRHQCLVYQGSPSSQLPALASMIRLKLKENHRCLYLNSPPMVAGLRSYLFAGGVDVPSEIAKGSLVLSSGTEHLQNGSFSIDRMLQMLTSAVVQALNDGYQGLLATGDVSWEFGPEKDFSKLEEYERRLEQLFEKYPTIYGICQYHEDTLPSEAVRQGILSHQAIFINEALSRINPHYTTADGVVGKLAVEALRENERRFREMIDALPAAIYTTDAEGRVLHFNPAAVEFSGRTPDLGTDRWCVSWKLYNADGTPMPHDECPMAIALKEGRPVRGAEAIIERPDGSRRWFTPYPTPLYDYEGKLVGGINMLVDISERKQAEELRQRDLEDARRLQQISTELIPQDNIQALYDQILEAAVGIMRSDFASMQMLVPERREGRGELLLLAHRGFRTQDAETWKWVGTDSNCICGQALRTGERAIVPDFEACVFMAGTPGLEAYRTAGIRAAQSTLLRSRSGKILGMISTHWRQPHNPPEHDLRLFDVLARQAADLIERKHAEDKLRESERYVRQILDSSPDCVKVLDLSGRIVSINPAGVELLELNDDSCIVHKEWTGFWQEDVRRSAYEAVAAAKSGKTAHFQGTCPTFAGKPKWWDVILSPVMGPEGQVNRILVVSRDITEHKRIEEALRDREARLRTSAIQLEQRVKERTRELTKSQQRLRALATELNVTEQRERQRLAGELHDYLGQILALSRIKLSLARQQPMQQPLAKLLDELQQNTDKALSYTRTLVSQLSPPVLHEFGLAMALPWLAEQMQERDLVVSLEIKTPIPPLPEDHALLLFQSVRELLVNCAKHAGVHEARVELEQIDESLYIAVSDQGLGFVLGDSTSNEAKASNRGFGLFSIRERMLSLGGRFDIRSDPGKGTKATLILPVTNALLELPALTDSFVKNKPERRYDAETQWNKGESTLETRTSERGRNRPLDPS